MKRNLVFAQIFFLVFSELFSQSSDAINLTSSVFKYDSTSNYIEVYYAINRSQLKSLTIDSVVFYDYTLKINLSENDSTIFSQSWNSRDSIIVSRDFNLPALGVVKKNIPTGNFILNFSLTDNFAQTEAARKEYPVISPNFQIPYSISDIELAYSVDESHETNMFSKGNYRIIPNPSLVYLNTALLNYYAEIYNNEQSVIVKRIIEDAKGNIVYEKEKREKSPYQSAIEIGRINLTSLESGSYKFRIQLLDTVYNVHSERERNFFVVNRNQTEIISADSEISNYLESKFAVFSEEECTDLYNDTKYLASKEEKQLWEKANNLDAKRKFLFEFWKKRDPERKSGDNSFLNEIMNRVQYARKYFTSILKDGVKSDRGRVLILYGFPDEINYYTSEANLKPYVTWRYFSIENGVTFIFGDIEGFSEYTLLHSDKRGELHNFHWQDRLEIK